MSFASDVAGGPPDPASAVLLSEVARSLLLHDDPGEVLPNVLQSISAQLELEVYFHYIADPECDDLRLAAYGGIDEELACQIDRLPLGEGVCGGVALSREAAILEDVASSSDPASEFLRLLGVRAYAGFPLLSGDNLLGTFGFGTRRRDSFSREELQLLESAAEMVACRLERQMLLASLERRSQELQAVTESKDELLAFLAHELRGSLSIIYSTARQQQRPEVGGLHEALEDIEQSSYKLIRLVDVMLGLARLELHSEVEIAPVSLRHVLTRVVRAFQRQRPERRVNLRLGRRAAAYVDANELYIEAILWNLLSNADKHSPPDAPISITLAFDAATTTITIADRGPGVPEEDLERIFDRFYRGRNAAGPAGLGLGLTICRRLTEAMRGKIWAERAEPSGLMVSFVLPNAVLPADA